MAINTNREKVAEGVPLAMIIKRDLKTLPELVMISQPRSVCAERFRRLKTNLVHRCRDEAKVIVVTSGIPGEGKSTVTLNLALAFAAEPGARTLVVDGDLRRPSIGKKLSIPPQLGLSEVLMGTASLAHAIVHLSNSSLHVLPAGSTVRDPHELIASVEAKELFNTLRERYDRVIVDTPPTLPFTDADMFGAMSDGVILVARAGMTPKAAYAQEVTAVTSTRILGTVLNGVADGLTGGKAYYDNYYHSYYDDDRKK